MRDAEPDYRLDENIGYLLRRCFQLSTFEFAQAAPDELSPSRFAALGRLVEEGAVSQNRLGRMVSADAATIKGIVDRLRVIDAVDVVPDPSDRRQRLVSITSVGRELYRQGVAASLASADAVMADLSAAERIMLVELLRKAADGRGAVTGT